ncbi:transposase [Streptomyces sp. NPDC088748]|uniref:transposase n=1 Tax=Streptomyces sp. NPDC088748 TaxID=3365887 RepID=UPI00381ECD45
MAVPRDRNGEFEPRLVPMNARRLAGFNDRTLSFYARGMSVRDVRSHLARMCGVEVSPDLIGKVTDPVIDELVTWVEPTPRPGLADHPHRCTVGEDPFRVRGLRAGSLGRRRRHGRPQRRPGPLGRS